MLRNFTEEKYHMNFKEFRNKFTEKINELSPEEIISSFEKLGYEFENINSENSFEFVESNLFSGIGNSDFNITDDDNDYAQSA